MMSVIFPNDKDDQKRACDDIKDAIDNRLEAYDEALKTHAAVNDDLDEVVPYGSAKVWVADGRLFAKF